MNMNSTQFATLSEPEVLDSDFEIEWVGAKFDSSTGTLFGGVLEKQTAIVVDVNPGLRLFAYDSSGFVTPVLEASAFDTSKFTDGKLHNVRVVYSGGVVSLYVDGNILLTDTWNLSSAVGLGVVGARDTTAFRTMSGNVLSFKVWKNGDRNTGELVTDLRFDEPDTIYQRNYASPIADENDPDWSGAILENVLPGDWETITRKAGDDFWVGDGDRVIEYAEGAL
tara:strand:+ start:105 stop:776 length:672 start_codon:yes stop_codon:yes gene_type:complete